MRVTIGIPIVDSVPGETLPYHMMLAAQIGRSCQIAIPSVMNLLPHDRARSKLFDLAIESKSDFMFFVDDDMIVPEDAYCRLFEVFNYKTPRAVAVSGYYYRRGWPYTSVWSRKNEAGVIEGLISDSGIHPIHYSGLGCCLIDVRWVQENLEKPYFSMGQDEFGTTITDDVTFFESIRRAGGVVYGNADVRCGHLGERKVICDRTAGDFRRHELEIRQATGQTIAID